MSVSAATKALAGASVMGAVGTGAFYLGRDRGIPIAELIKASNPNKRLISSSKALTDQAWKDAWKAYIDAYKSNNKNPLNLRDWDSLSKEGDQNAPQSLVEACSSLRGEKVSDAKSERYDLALKYCTRNTLVKDIIEEGGERVLLVKTSTTGTSAEWQAVWKSYKDDNTDNSKNLWSLNDWTSVKSSNDAPESFMTQCESKAKEAEWDLKSKKYLEVNKYCTSLKSTT
ncbi:hypothetical protein MHF_0388 [Mycoplasma haemofelis Ohio2]|uniref:Uncharacterized protein n=1 Tax=Mycoplasma haemofelis (strain Ohio2) TaxID=859194 RepID=F6FH59_MYCHI|nr:hypothetical protein MHF_0388 [Mycoplasma haemofelis Ohio2]